jgi:hypothetical protein
MTLLSNLKATALRAADRYNQWATPYKPFVRPFLPLTTHSLKERETECYDDLEDFWLGGKVIQNHLYLTPGLGPDLGDQATFHGIYTAMLALKWYVTKDEGVKLEIQNALKGMASHQTAHGENRHRLIRGYIPGTLLWQDDPSNDTLTGHFCGLYFVLRYGPPECRLLATDLILALVESLKKNNFCLITPIGTPTLYGKLINGALTDPLQFTLCLAIFCTADNLTNHRRYCNTTGDLFREYGALVPYAKTGFGNYENWNDDHRAAIHLMVLSKEGDFSIRQAAKDGLMRMWDLYGRRGNIWMNAFISMGLPAIGYLDSMRADGRAQALQVLGEYELSAQRYDTELDWTATPVPDGHGNVWKPDIVQVKGNPRSTNPLPLWVVGRQDFVWQRHRYSVKDWVGNKEPTQRFNGGAFLCAYWACRAASILTEDD